jgi:hypothetical protein
MQEKRHNNFKRPTLLAEYEYEYGRLMYELALRSRIVANRIEKRAECKYEYKLEKYEIKGRI